MVLSDTIGRRSAAHLAPLRRGVGVLEALAGSAGGLSFTEIQRAVPGLGDASLARLLAVMVSERLVGKDTATGTYRVGTRFVRLARQAVGAVPKADVLAPVLSALAQRAGQSAGYWEGEGAAIVLKARAVVEDSSALTSPHTVNRRVTRHPCGQIYLAHLEPPARRRVIAAAKERPAVGSAAFEARMARIREEGFLIEPGETGKNIFRVAAPVFYGTRGPFAGALAIVAAGTDWTTQQVNEWKRQVVEGAAAATRLLAEYYGGDNG